MSNIAEFDTVGEYGIKMALQGILAYYVYMKGGLWTLCIFFFQFLSYGSSALMAASLTLCVLKAVIW